MKAKLLTFIAIAILLAFSASAELWKEVSTDDYHDKNDLLKFSVMQMKITDLDIDMNTISLMIFNANGDFQETATLKKNQFYYYKNLARIKPVDFIEDGILERVLIKVEYKVDVSIIGHDFPTELYVGKSHDGIIEVYNDGTEHEKIRLDIVPEVPFLRADSTRIVTSVNPQVLNARIHFGVEPLEGVTDGTAEIIIYWGDEVLDTATVSGITVHDTSSGFINKIQMPRSLYKGETYAGKMEIHITNDADISGKFRVVLSSDDIKFETGSKFGSDTLAENIGPHVTKHLYVRSFTPLKAGDIDITVELYSNGRIVDKRVETVHVQGYVDIVEEDEPEAPPEAEESLPHGVIEEVAEEPPVEVVEPEEPAEDMITGSVVTGTDGDPDGWFTRLLLVFVVIVIGTIIYQRFFKRKLTLTKEQMDRLDQRTGTVPRPGKKK